MQFTTVLHPVRKQFGISCNEYCVADMIEKLASPNAPVPGWCSASHDYLGAEMGLSRQSIFSIVQGLVDKNLIEKGGTKRLRPTQLWVCVVAICKESLQLGVKNLDEILAETVKKLDTNCKESLQQECKESLQLGVKNLDTYNKSDNKILENKIENTLPAVAGACEVVEVEAVEVGPDEKKGNTPIPVAVTPFPSRRDQFTYKSDSEKVNVPFSVWWPTYEKDVGEVQARKLWLDLTDVERLKAQIHTPLYVKSTPDKQYRLKAANYLTDKAFNDEVIQQRPQRPGANRRTSAEQSRAETGSELDRLVSEYFGT